ncbi:MAG: dihydroorotase [Clostridia bacterium]|nr:dihydroorotase [Clostridia bacterium]
MRKTELKNLSTQYFKAVGNPSANYSFSLIDSLDLTGDNYVVLPGFCDVHVHFREPGFSYKETIKSGSQSAARGGYTAVCTMPNLSPVPDSVEHIAIQQDIIDRDAVISVYPYGSITVEQKGEQLVDFDKTAGYVIAYSDDGKGIQSEETMLEAMTRAKKNDKMIVAHCEDNSLLFGGYIHDGQYAKAHGHRGICSKSEYGQIERDLALAKKTGVKYHVCHISTKESVALIRRAKSEGVDVTCETAPHYLTMDDSYLFEDGKMKMNPPLRGQEDRLALIEGIVDGTIDMIATDHAPHSKEEKSRGLEKSAFGVVGLETAFPALYTHLVKTGIISMEKLIDLLVISPRKRFNIPFDDDFSVWDLSREFVVNPEEFLSKGRATPYDGQTLFGENLLTVKSGKIVYKR